MDEEGIPRSELKNYAAALVLWDLAEVLAGARMKQAGLDPASREPGAVLSYLWAVPPGPEDDDLRALLRCWWAGACDGDLRVSASAVSALEDVVETALGEGEDPDLELRREVFCGAIELMTRAAREGGYA